MIAVKVNYMLVFTGIFSSLLELDAKSSFGASPDEDQSHIVVYKDREHNITRTINLRAEPLSRVLIKDTNKYMLYTRENPEHAQELYGDRPASITGSSYNPSDQTVFIVHGWNGNWESNLNPAIRDAFLSVIYANVIVMDWSLMASTDYATATATAPRVGKFLGQFVQFLHRNFGVSYNTMHLVGHGLGAHVVGNAGTYLQPSCSVARITGLDPAGPLWDGNSSRLKAKDAVYVEAIHTDCKLLGTSLRCGDVDYYPNGGITQPSCSKSMRDSCSHARAWKLFAATIRYNHLVGRRCASEDTLGLDVCFHEYLPMGNDDLLKNGSGVYRLATNGKYPYQLLL